MWAFRRLSGLLWRRLPANATKSPKKMAGAGPAISKLKFSVEDASVKTLG